MTDFTHPSLDDLADLHEGLLADDRSRELSVHVRTCQVCTAAMASLDEVDTLLAAAALPHPMPDSVAASLDEALRRASLERSAGVSSLAEHRRTSSERVAPALSRRPRWGLIAGAAAAVAVLGFAGINVGGSLSSSDSTASSNEADTGQGTGPRDLTQSDAAGAPTSSGTMLAPNGPDAVSLPGLTRRSLPAFASKLEDGKSPLALPPSCARLDVASGATAAAVRWNGRPAVVVVDPTTSRATVYACGSPSSRLFSTAY